jgi:hypothetical protein
MQGAGVLSGGFFITVSAREMMFELAARPFLCQVVAPSLLFVIQV